MNNFSELRSVNGFSTLIRYDFTSSFQQLVQEESVDCFIVSTEDGFSPLGAARSFFAEELGIGDHEIRSLAHWNRFVNPNVSFIVLPSSNPVSRLKGIILAPSETSLCYEQFATPRYGQPYRDFYYNVSYEAISYACRSLSASKLAISHLSGSGRFHEDIATCTAEALAHFCDAVEQNIIKSFSFVGCCINLSHLHGIRRLNSEAGRTQHQAIRVTISRRHDYDVVDLDWRQLQRSGT